MQYAQFVPHSILGTRLGTRMIFVVATRFGATTSVSHDTEAIYAWMESRGARASQGQLCRVDPEVLVEFVAGHRHRKPPSQLSPQPFLSKRVRGTLRRSLERTSVI